MPDPSPLPAAEDSVPATHPAGLADGATTTSGPLLTRLPGPVADRVERWGAARCLAVLVLLLVVFAGIGGDLLGRHTAEAAPAAAVTGTLPALDGGGDGFSDPAPAASAASAGDLGATGDGVTGATAAGSIVVDVAGKVRRPGLVTLPAGSRVADAIAAAGGLRGRLSAGAVNLAARVGDGQLLVVGGHAGSAGTATTGADPTAGDGSEAADGSTAPVDLNSATEAQLEALPGIGPVLAGRILAYGQAHNGFTSVEQLRNVTGIGPSHYAEIAALVTT